MDEYEDRHGTLSSEQMESMSVDHWDARLDEYSLIVSGERDQTFKFYRDADSALQRAIDDHGLKDSDLSLTGVSGDKVVAIFYRRTIDDIAGTESEFFLDARM